MDRLRKAKQLHQTKLFKNSLSFLLAMPIYRKYRKRTKVFLFLIGGLLGFLLDTFYRSITEHQFAFEGFLATLFGKTIIVPFLPVYGFGLVLIYLIQPFAQQQRWFIRPLIFGGSLTVLEFFAGVFVNLILKTRLWDYSGGFFNLYGHVDLVHTVYWAILGTAVSYFFTKYPPDAWFSNKK